MRRPITITLGEQEFEIRPLTLGQVEAIEAIIAERGLSGVCQGNKVIAAALARGTPNFDLDEVEGTPREIAEATKAILQHGGFTPGEVPPAGANAGDAG